jgi:hypothetical protein
VLDEKYSDESFDENEGDNIENGQFEKESNHNDHSLGERQIQKIMRKEEFRKGSTKTIILRHHHAKQYIKNKWNLQWVLTINSSPRKITSYQLMMSHANCPL